MQFRLAEGNGGRRSTRVRVREDGRIHIHAPKLLTRPVRLRADCVAAVHYGIWAVDLTPGVVLEWPPTMLHLCSGPANLVVLLSSRTRVRGIRAAALPEPARREIIGSTLVVDALLLRTPELGRAQEAFTSVDIPIVGDLTHVVGCLYGLVTPARARTLRELKLSR